MLDPILTHSSSHHSMGSNCLWVREKGFSTTRFKWVELPVMRKVWLNVITRMRLNQTSHTRRCDEKASLERILLNDSGML
ncbi:hypothetical protein Peur_054699 [Populus x canadensis]